MRPATCALLLALSTAAVAAPVGWRRDGSGAVAGATLPDAWTEASTCWEARLGAWSNGQPVVAGDRVIVTAEPDRVVGLDARDGHVRWSTRLDPIDGLPLAEREGALQRVTAARAAATRLAEVRAAFARLQHDVRRGTGDAAALERLGGEITALQATVAAAGDLIPRDDLGMVGATTPTPVVDGDRVYVLAGNGVAAALDLDGRRIWTRWLGAPVQPMKGWFVGHASSPVLVDGVLVVPFRRLRGLDPATGRELWATGPAWDHYGTPAVARPGGLGVVITPAGDVVRARDGAVLASGLGSIFHTGPVVSGDVVVQAGNLGSQGRGTSVTATRLVRVGDGVRADRLWSRTLDDGANMGAMPTVAGGRLWLVELAGRVRALDLATGAVVSDAPLKTDVGSFYASPVLVGDRLLLTGDRDGAVVLRLDPAGTWAVLGTSRLPTSRSTPWVQGSRAWFRSQAGVRCVEVR